MSAPIRIRSTTPERKLQRLHAARAHRKQLDGEIEALERDIDADMQLKTLRRDGRELPPVDAVDVTPRTELRTNQTLQLWGNADLLYDD